MLPGGPPMQYDKDRDNFRTGLHQRFQALESTDLEKLSRRSDLGSFHFEDAVPFIRAIIEFLRDIVVPEQTHAMTSSMLRRVNEHVQSTYTLVSDINTFSLTQENVEGRKATLLERVPATYEAALDKLLPIHAWCQNRRHSPASIAAAAQAASAAIAGDAAAKKTQIESLTSGILSNLQAFEPRVVSALERAEHSLATATSLTERAQQAIVRAEAASRAVMSQSATAGISIHSRLFHEDSGSHAKAAKRWLVASLVLGSLTGLVAGAMLALAYGHPPTSVPEAIHIAVSKIVVLSVLTALSLFAVRNYRAQKHNETLNRHRQNALATFQTFVEGAGDERIRDAILLHAAQSVFGPRSTGFDATDASPTEFSPVVDVLRKSSETLLQKP